MPRLSASLKFVRRSSLISKNSIDPLVLVTSIDRDQDVSTEIMCGAENDLTSR